MNFDDLPTIPAVNIFKVAMVSDPRGNFVLKQLIEARVITPTTTPTGRKLLTPADGKRLYEAITQAA